MFDNGAYSDLIAEVDAAVANNDKGKAFEELACYLFQCLDGIEITHRDARMASEEIDIVLWNAQIEAFLRPWDDVILVECKNWSERIGAAVLDAFIAKLRRRARKTGILIAANGVTGGFVTGNGDEPGAVGILTSALQDGIRVVVITLDDLRNITSADDLRDLIRKRYCGLFVHRVF